MINKFIIENINIIIIIINLMKLRSGKIINNKTIIKKDKNIDKICNLFKNIKLIDEIDDLIILMNKNNIDKKNNKK